MSTFSAKPPALNKFFESSSAGSLSGLALNTFAHGLGVKPSLIQVYAKCTVANNGFSVGDEMIMSNQGNAISATHYGYSVMADATNIVIKMANSGTQGIDFSAGTLFAVSNAQWELHVRAWA